MESNRFNFNQVGKQRPYKVPENFFDRLEENILAQTKEITPVPPAISCRPLLRIQTIGSALLAIAASLTLFFVLYTHRPDTSNGLACIEQAFNSLNTEDQNFLIETYQDDLFIEEQVNVE